MNDELIVSFIYKKATPNVLVFVQDKIVAVIDFLYKNKEVITSNLVKSLFPSLGAF